MGDEKRGFFGRLWDRGENTAKSAKRDVVEGLTFLPRATYEGVREGIASSRSAGEHDRAVSRMELAVLGGMIVVALVAWWVFSLLKLGGLGMIVAAMAAVIYFNKHARAKLRKSISDWLNAKSGQGEASASNLSPELLREMAMVRLARVKHRLGVWDDLGKEERRRDSLALLAAILDDLTFEGNVVASADAAEGVDAKASDPTRDTSPGGVPMLPETRGPLT